MPKYLFKFWYGPEAVSAIADKGASSRVEVVNDLASGLGGKVESFYYAWGEEDGYLICEFPDQSAALALSLAVNASCTVSEGSSSFIAISSSTTLRSASTSFGVISELVTMSDRMSTASGRSASSTRA